MNIFDNLGTSFTNYKNDAIKMIPTILTSIIIFLIFLSIAYYYNSLLNTNITAENNKHMIIYKELGYIVYYFIIIIGIIFAVCNLGIQTASILTILATFGLGIGLSLQNIFGNIASGLYIGLSNLYQIGDIIEVNGTMGKVVDFDIFSTIIYDSKSQVPITIPNNIIDKNILINYTQNNTRLLTTDFFISNNNKKNFDDISTIIYNSLQNCKYIIDKKNINVYISTINSSGITLSVSAIIDSYDTFVAGSDIKSIVKNALLDHNIM
jgi:small conductance mechanosensitive channel